MKTLRSGLGAVLVVFSSLISVSLQSLDSPANDGCGKASQELAQVYAAGGRHINAQTAYGCLTDVSFQRDDAENTLKQLRLYLQFYSAQAYFAKPPTPELELTPVDLNKTLDDIESNIKSGKYQNEYSFNKDLFNLFGDYRDGHVSFSPLCYTAFVFQHEYPIISIGKTPNTMPDIYVVAVREAGFEPGDKIVQINGQPAVDYLTQMANSHPELTWVDPDARFNQLLAPPSVNGEYHSGIFAARSTYATEDLNLTWENGTTTKVEWYASLDPSISPNSFHSTDTFYKKVCVRPKQETLDVLTGSDTKAISWVGDESPITGGNNDHHPKRKRSEPKTAGGLPQRHILKRSEGPASTIHQTLSPALLTSAHGEISLHILDHETGVLVVTSFTSANETASGVNEDDDATTIFMNKFVSLATEAISDLRQRGITKIIIDLSGNLGGLVSLGENLAMQLFPEVNHFFGTNMRWNPALATMLTKGEGLNATYWDLGHYRKMDGSEFSSYEEFLGPVHRDDDYFTVIAIPDIVESNAEDSAKLPSSYSGPQPFDTDNIALVSSGMCGSTCAIFAEAMLEQGVHSVTFGGRHREGPMQTVGGIKGSQVLGFDEIANWAYQLLDDVSQYDFIPGVLTVATKGATINLRNSWRKEDQDTPIEFIYSPSEHKLAYTAEMYKNQTAIWQAAKDVVWGGAGDLCGGGCDSGEGRVTWSSIGELVLMKLHGHSKS